MTATCPNGITVTISPRSRQAALHAIAARAARCVNAAPAPDTARSCRSTNTTHCSPPPEPTPPPPSSSSPTDSTGRWSNDRSPGSCAAAAARSATAASPATGSDSLTAAPLSTSAASSTSASSLEQRMDHRQLNSGPGADKEGTTPTGEQPTSAADSHPQHRLFGRSCPRTHHHATPLPHPEKSHLLSGLLTDDGLLARSVLITAADPSQQLAARCRRGASGRVLAPSADPSLWREPRQSRIRTWRHRPGVRARLLRRRDDPSHGTPGRPIPGPASSRRGIVVGIRVGRSLADVCHSGKRLAGAGVIA